MFFTNNPTYLSSDQVITSSYLDTTPSCIQSLFAVIKEHLFWYIKIIHWTNSWKNTSEYFCGSHYWLQINVSITDVFLTLFCFYSTKLCFTSFIHSYTFWQCIINKVIGRITLFIIICTSGQTFFKHINVDFGAIIMRLFFQCPHTWPPLAISIYYRIK